MFLNRWILSPQKKKFTNRIFKTSQRNMTMWAEQHQQGQLKALQNQRIDTIVLDGCGTCCDIYSIAPVYAIVSLFK